jgi:hypothetical protein
VASRIAQTTLNDVLSAVQSGIDDGDGTDQIARNIDGVSTEAWLDQTLQSK